MGADGGFLAQLAVAVGLVAGLTAVGGFLAHVRPALARQREVELRRMTAVGGLAGLVVALGILLLSAFIE